MRRDGRLSGVLHVLLHMAEAGKPVTSEQLAAFMGTNPVVVRRTLAGLRDRGLITSDKGHGGGWSIVCNFAEVTLCDIHRALGSPELLAVGHRSEAPRCLVEQAVNATLGRAFEDADALLLQRLREVTLAQLSAAFHDRLAVRSGATGPVRSDAA